MSSFAEARAARNALLAILLIAAASGCRSLVGAEDVQVRIRNASSVTFDLVTVQFPGEVVSYGTIAPGSKSAYRVVDRAYRYARIEVEVGGRTYLLQPIDYVGESLLAGGRYTYHLGLDADASQLSLQFTEDDP